MAGKPTTAAGYNPEQTAVVRSCALYIATLLGDLMDDLVVVGGFVPSLLIDQDNLPSGVDKHTGTMDLDLGLSLALLDEGRYEEVSERLRKAGFAPDEKEPGKVVRQRWRAKGPFGSVTVDFLIQPTSPQDKGGKLKNMEPDFAAIIARGLSLAFRDRKRVTLEGETLLGETATREIWVCGPGAYIVLKALAFKGRGENKDAYDLYYVARNFGAGVANVIVALRPLLGEAESQEAVKILQRDFLEHNNPGPRRVAMFLSGAGDDEIQADVVGVIQQLVDGCKIEKQGA